MMVVLKSTILLLCLLLFLSTVRAQYGSAFTIFGGERDPQVPVDCTRYPNADVKARALLNQDLAALRTYFNDKCGRRRSLSAATCDLWSVQKAEEDICVLRRFKARLFPNGVDAPAQPITSFNCSKYTKSEQEGCTSPFNYRIFPFGGVNPQAPSQTIRNNWDVVIGEKTAQYRSLMERVQALRRQRDRTAGGPGGFGAGGGFGGSYRLFSKITESPGSAQSYQGAATSSRFARQIFQAPNPWSAVQNTQSRNPWSQFGRVPGSNPTASQTTNTQQQSGTTTNNQFSTANTQARPASTQYGPTNPNMNVWSNTQQTYTNSGTRTPSTQQNTQTLNSNTQQSNPYMSNTQYSAPTSNQFGARSPFTASTRQNTQTSTSNTQSTSTQYSAPVGNQFLPTSYGGYGSSGFLGGGPFGSVQPDPETQLFQQAQEIGNCLPPGSLNIQGQDFSYGFGGSVTDPLLVLCKVRDNPKLFQELEMNVQTQFLGGMDSQCSRFSVPVAQEVLNYLTRTTWEQLIESKLSQTGTFDYLTTSSCAYKELYNRLKQNDATVTSRLNCGQFDSQINEINIDRELSQKYGQNSYFGASFVTYGRFMLQELTNQLSCEGAAVRNILYAKYDNLKLALCLMQNDIKQQSYYSRYTFENDLTKLLDIQTDLYLLRRLPLNQQDNNARNILNNNYAQVNIPDPDSLDTYTEADWFRIKQDKLTTAKAVYNSLSPTVCSDAFQRSQVASFPVTVSTAVSDCQRGNPSSLYQLESNVEQVFEQLSDRTSENNMGKLCVLYTRVQAIPDSFDSNLPNDIKILAFSEQLFELIEEESKKAKASTASSATSSCQNLLTPTSQQRLGTILSSFASGVMENVQLEMYKMLNPTDANPPLNDLRRAEYKRCQYKKIFDLSSTQMCQAFRTLMDNIRRDINQKVTSFRNGAAINLEKEIGAVLMRPTNPRVVTSSTRSEGTCTGNWQVTAQGSYFCPRGITCCQNRGALCENNQCRFTVWQEEFCKLAAAALGESASDPEVAFMESIEKGSLIKNQELYTSYRKYSQNSQDCQAVYANPDPFTNPYGSSSYGGYGVSLGSYSGYGGTTPYITNYGATSATTRQAGTPWIPLGGGVGGFPFRPRQATTIPYDSALSMLNTYSSQVATSSSFGLSAYSGYGAYGSVGTGQACIDTESMKRFICAWHVVFNTVATSACPSQAKRNPLFPSYEYDYNLYDQCTQEDTSFQPYLGLPTEPPLQNNTDCEVLTESEQKAADNGRDVGYVMLEAYNSNRFGAIAWGGGYGAGATYSAAYGGGANFGTTEGGDTSFRQSFGGYGANSGSPYQAAGAGYGATGSPAVSSSGEIPPGFTF